MSTKIYTGFIVQGTSTQEALTILGRERPAVQRRVDTKNHSELIRRITRFIDDYCILRHTQPDAELADPYKDALTKSPWWHCLEELNKEQATCRGGNTREPFIDCDAELTLYLHESTGHLVGYVQEERLGVYTHLMTVPGIQEYGYWNNSDPLDGVSEEAWGVRGEAWDAVLDSQTAVKFSMKWQPSLVDPRQLLAPFPDILNRAQRIAKNTVTSNALRNDPQAQATGGNMSGTMRALRRVETELHDTTSAMHAEYLVLIERYKTYLVPTVEEHLSRPVGQLPGLALSPCVG